MNEWNSLFAATAGAATTVTELLFYYPAGKSNFQQSPLWPQGYLYKNLNYVVYRCTKIKKGDVLLTLHAPAAFKKQLGPVPPAVKIITAGKTYNQLHWFATSKAQVEKETKKILELIKAGLICWIYFPKGSSSIQTDLTRDKGWDTLLAHNEKLTWLSLVAFDNTWSAFAFRLKTGAGTSKKTISAERPVLQYLNTASKTIRIPEDLALLLNQNKTAVVFLTVFRLPTAKNM